MTNIYEKSAIFLAIIMCIPVYVAISGFVAFLDNSNPLHYEGLYVTGYMVIFSSAIWIPHLILNALKWKRISRKIQALTFIPTGLMLALAVLAEINGIPW